MLQSRAAAAPASRHLHRCPCVPQPCSTTSRGPCRRPPRLQLHAVQDTRQPDTDCHNPQTALGRRQLLAAGLLLPALSAAAPTTAAPAAAQAPGVPATKHFVGQAGFVFDHPADWLKAYDRTGNEGAGTLALVGNFSTLQTFAVARIQADQLLAPPGEDGSSYESLLDRAADSVLEEAWSLPSTMGLTIKRKAEEKRSDGRTYYCLEYVLESCRGEVQEGRGGKNSCLGAFGQEGPTVSRHYLTATTIAGEWAYLLNASALEERWAAAERPLSAVLESFRFEPVSKPGMVAA